LSKGDLKIPLAEQIFCSNQWIETNLCNSGLSEKSRRIIQ